MTKLKVNLNQETIDSIENERSKMTYGDKINFVKNILVTLRGQSVYADDVSENARELPLSDGRTIQYVKEAIPIKQLDENNLMGFQDTLVFVARELGPSSNKVTYRNHPATSKRFIGTGINGHQEINGDTAQIAVFIFDRLRPEDYIDLKLSFIAASTLKNMNAPR